MATGVTMYYIKQVLGASTDDLGQLCKHVSINMFSRHKPVRFPGIPEEDAEHWESTRMNFGIHIPEILPGVIPEWYYEQPTGGIDSPYRLGDFSGYDHYAPPILQRNQKDYIFDYTDNNIVLISYNSLFRDIEPSEVLLHYKAGAGEAIINNLGELYLAMNVLNQQGEVIGTAITGNPIAQDAKIEYYPLRMSEGIYDLYFYLVSMDKKHKFHIYSDETMPNPCKLTIIRSGFQTTLAGVISTTGLDNWMISPITKRILVRFPVVVQTKNYGFGIALDIKNTANKEITLQKSAFTINMLSGGVLDNATMSVIADIRGDSETIPTFVIAAGGTRRIVIHVKKIVGKLEPIPVEIDVETKISYNGKEIWNGTVLIQPDNRIEI